MRTINSGPWVQDMLELVRKGYTVTLSVSREGSIDFVNVQVERQGFKRCRRAVLAFDGSTKHLDQLFEQLQ